MAGATASVHAEDLYLACACLRGDERALALVVCRQKVVSEVQRILRDELNISPADFESLERLVISQLDVSVSMLPEPLR